MGILSSQCVASGQPVYASSWTSPPAQGGCGGGEISPQAREDLYEIAQQVKPRLNLAQLSPGQAVQPHPLAAQEPSTDEKTHNIIQHAAEKVGLNGAQANLVLEAYDESLSPGSQGLNAKFLPEVSPKIFSLIGKELKRESERPSSSISRHEMNQWVGFKTRSSPKQLQKAEACLAPELQHVATLSKASSDIQFLNQVKEQIAGGRDPVLGSAVPNVVEAANTGPTLASTFGRK
jgi:hypothetical protein